MVEIFKTDVTDASLAALLIDRLKSEFPFCKINFDLQDCDRVLRVEIYQSNFRPELVIELLRKENKFCEIIPG